MVNIIKNFSLVIVFFLIAISCVNSNIFVKDANSINVLPRESFVYLEKKLQVTSCIGKQCLSMDYRSFASGFIVNIQDDGAFIITAAHFCENQVMPGPGVKMKASYKANTISGNKFSSTLLHYERNIDVCLLFAKNMLKEVKPVQIAKMAPVPGDKVFNISAPDGIYVPGMAPILEGRYNGEMGGSSCYTVHAAPGSSGSMIVNKKGNLVGMIHSVYIRFNVISLSTNYYDLKRFIEKYLRKYILYKKIKDFVDDLNLDDIFTSKI